MAGDDPAILIGDMADQFSIKKRTPRAAPALILTFGLVFLVAVVGWVIVDAPYERLNPVDRAIRDTTSEESLVPILFPGGANRATVAGFLRLNGYGPSGDLTADCQKYPENDKCSLVSKGFKEMYVRDGRCLLYIVHVKFENEQLRDALGESHNRCVF